MHKTANNDANMAGDDWALPKSTWLIKANSATLAAPLMPPTMPAASTTCHDARNRKTISFIGFLLC
jgi:hypothetical protein